MCDRSLAARHFAHLPLMAFVSLLACTAVTWAQQIVTPEEFKQSAVRRPIQYHVRDASQRLEMIVNSSRILTMEGTIPQAQVNNPDIVRLQPLSKNQIQTSALKAGVTQINLWDEDKNVYTVDIVVYGDARELEMVLRSEFPSAALKIRPMNTSVLVSGYVPRPDMVPRIRLIAEDYYPKVVDNMVVGGVQTVLLQVKVMEVSRNKLRALGIDWSYVNNNDFLVSSVSGLINAATASTGATLAGTGQDTLRLGIVGDNTTFLTFIEALQQRNVVKVLAEPNLVTMSGRPASFLVGGEFPILVPSGTIGTATIEFREYGTRVDFVPIVLGNGSIRLEVRPSITEIDESRNVTADTITVPALRTHTVDTAVEMQAGQTLALAGLIQERIESENKGLPWISDIPYLGTWFRRVEESVNEIEMLILVTPHLVDPMESHEVPGGPGRTLVSPNDHELYFKGFLEVPRCNDVGSCVNCQTGGYGHPAHLDPLPAEGEEPSSPIPSDPVPSDPVPDEKISTLEEPSTPAVFTLRSSPQQDIQGVPHESTVADKPLGPNKGHLPSSPVVRQQNRSATQPTIASDSHRPAPTTPKMIGPIGYDVQE